MRKLISLVVLSVLVFGMFGENPVSAKDIKLDKPKPEQVIYTRKCCDGGGTVRCIIDNWVPVGSGCFCYGQGYGVAC
jgi:hypothetical protein